MRLNKLIIDSVRNHDKTEMEFDKRLNVFFGLNGSGKTSVLESISVCSLSKSFHNVTDSSLINKDNHKCSVFADCVNDLDIPYKISVGIEAGKKKAINSTLGENLLPKDIIGEIPLIVLSPDSKTITYGSPANRRQFIDKVLSQAGKSYMLSLLDLKKSLKQRNNLLSDVAEGKFPDLELLDSWTEMFIKNSVDIIYRRNAFIDDFKPVFLKYYERVTDNKEKIGLDYQPDCLYLKDVDLGDKKVILNELNKAAIGLKNKEMRRGTTLFGPQKDEINIRVNGGTAREFASQGQHKSLLISIKFAEFEYLKNVRKETPVILLDDIFSELDSERTIEVLDLVFEMKAQTFITVTEKDMVEKHLGRAESFKFFKLHKGEIV